MIPHCKERVCKEAMVAVPGKERGVQTQEGPAQLRDPVGLLLLKNTLREANI